jgi:hypothetical protein
VSCYENFFKNEDCNRLFLNVANSPSADAFCGLQICSDKEHLLMLELHQYKHCRKTTITQALFDDEWESAVAKGRNDFFIFFTPGDAAAVTQLKPFSAIVDKNNFKDYFGPFAARAFRLWCHITLILIPTNSEVLRLSSVCVLLLFVVCESVMHFLLKVFQLWCII